MIELRDKDKNRVAGLVDYENLCIESVLESGDKTLSFYYPKKCKYYDEIVEEAYIRTKKDEFVVKARELDDEYTKFECSLNLEELEGNIFDRFESVEQTITSALNLAVVGTGWTVKDNTLKKRRTVRCTNKSSLEIVREIKKVYRVDIVFNTLGKQIEVYEHLGEDKGTYFIDSLNLIALQVQSDSRQYATRIIAEGKDGLSFSDINNGKNYVENYQYSNKVKTIYWKDERYSVKENLLEDARAKLEELSKPFRSYSASILNLAELNPRYSSILDFKLGDAINLISKKNKIKDKQRIVKTIEYPQDHSRDTVELANATLKFEDIQQENQETTDTVNNITTDNGTVDGSTIDSITTKQIEDFEANVIKVAKLKAILAEIENLHVNKADIQNLNAVVARIGTLEATKASITELNAIYAIIQQIKAGKADITDLNAAVAKVGILENKTAVLENALAGNLTADNFKTNAITAGSAVIAEGAIGSSQISSLSVNKLEAGDITTSKHRIVSSDGTVEIVGNQILINRNNINRVILGEYRKSDGTTEYGLLVRAKDGQTIMLDGNGVHNAGITDGAIDNNKVADNANISGNKLDINSVIREVNTHGTETIKGTKVQIGDRTLDVELSTQKNTITEHSKELSSQKASLTALDNALKFKVDSQTFTQSTETINSNINRAKEEAIIKARSIPDTRNYNQPPSWYMEKYPNQTITEFKYSDIVQISGPKVYGTLETTTPWWNASGGYPTQIFRSNSTATFQRHGINETTWSSWEQIENTQGSQAKANSALSNAKSYSDSKKQEAIKAAENLALEKSNLAKKYAEDVATAKANLAKTEAIANADGKISDEEKKRIQQAQENLNTAISKADKAKQDAINEANRVAELKKQEAISSANSHADNKANEALNNAKAFVNAEITTVNSHLNKATAEINVLKEKIESKVSQSDMEKSISNITIGGRNLALGTSLNYSNPYSGFDGGINKCPSVAKVITDGLKIGDIVTVRLLYKYENIVQASNKTNSAWLQGAGDVTGWGSGAFSGSVRLNNFSGNGTYEFLYSFTVTKEHMKNNYWDVNLRHDYILNGSVCWKMFKVEKGNKATDWTPAPEDTNQLIVDNIKTVTDKITTVESKFTQENNSIKASVQDLNSTTQSITTNVSNINRDLTSKINSNLDAAKSFATDIAISKANLAKEQAIANADGKVTEEERKRIQQAQENLNTAIARADKAKQDAINTASTDATNKANNALNSAKAFINAEITTVNNKVHNVESNLNILSNEIKSKVSQSDIDKSISEIKLGGRNLLSNTYKFKNLNNWSLSKGPNQNGTLELIEDSIYGNVLHTTKPNSVSWWVLANYPIRLPEGKFTVGKEYTISFYAKAKEPVSIDISFIDANGLNSVSSSLHFNLTTEWKYYYGTIRAKATGNTPELYITSNIGEHWWTMFKLEEGNKPSDWSPAPEDTTSLVEDSIRVIDTKISDVSSSVTQLRDSVTTQINSINSKTHSIETTLGGKANKQEVTEVNNRVATIKASLDGITQRVSATESKTQTLETNLNGKASKQEVNNVSSKVVSLETNLNGITNRVSNTESRINTLDGKVASAVTNQQFTEFKQSNDKFKFTVEQRSSVSNILPNGSFFGGDRGWLHNGAEFWSGPYSGYGFKGRMTGAIKNRTSYNNPERFLQTHKAYKVKKNTTYTISFHYACEMNIHSMEAYIVLSDTEHGDYAQPIRILEKPGGTQSDPNNEIPFTYKFNTGNHEWVWLRFDHNGMKPGTNWDQYCWLYVSEIGIYEGDVGAVKWTPKGGEVYSANYQMDGLGFKGTFEDGTYASLGKDGLEWYNAGTGHAYHALTYVTSFDIPVGNPGKAYIKLPAEFTKRRSSLKWTVALRGYYYSTSGNFFPFHVHCTGARDYIENGLVVCEVQGLCKIQNGSNSGDVQFRPLTAMLIAIA
ncbi:phage tail spike protein [Clostridium perfringens]|uniref:phage tail spike protein n=1 Tax=Clostridium perfringens TaxID=1502 RepID=UPI0024BCC731|nr:phage tail spike protein [Clostridium perfringens]